MGNRRRPLRERNRPHQHDDEFAFTLRPVSKGGREVVTVLMVEDDEDLREEIRMRDTHGRPLRITTWPLLVEGMNSRIDHPSSRVLADPGLAEIVRNVQQSGERYTRDSLVRHFRHLAERGYAEIEESGWKWIIAITVPTAEDMARGSGS